MKRGTPRATVTAVLPKRQNESCDLPSRPGRVSALREGREGAQQRQERTRAGAQGAVAESFPQAEAGAS